jgi:hypothetical protein
LKICSTHSINQHIYQTSITHCDYLPVNNSVAMMIELEFIGGIGGDVTLPAAALYFHGLI